VRPHAEQLVPLAIDVIKWRAGATVRGTALGALSQLIRATADAASPHVKFPHLLPSLLTLLQSERGDASYRQELMRLIGVLVHHHTNPNPRPMPNPHPSMYNAGDLVAEPPPRSPPDRWQGAPDPDARRAAPPQHATDGSALTPNKPGVQPTPLSETPAVGGAVAGARAAEAAAVADAPAAAADALLVHC
jgi:hypothetical protein